MRTSLEASLLRLGLDVISLINGSMEKHTTHYYDTTYHYNTTHNYKTTYNYNNT